MVIWLVEKVELEVLIQTTCVFAGPTRRGEEAVCCSRTSSRRVMVQHLKRHQELAVEN